MKKKRSWPPLKTHLILKSKLIVLRHLQIQQTPKSNNRNPIPKENKIQRSKAKREDDYFIKSRIHDISLCPLPRLTKKYLKSGI